MSIKKIIAVDNEEGESGSIGSEGSKGKEAASPLFSGCCPRIVSLPLEGNTDSIVIRFYS